MMAPFFPLYFWCSSPCNPKIFTFFPQLTTNKAKTSELNSILRTHYLQQLLLGLSWAHIWEATCVFRHVVITSSVRLASLQCRSSAEIPHGSFLIFHGSLCAPAPFQRPAQWPGMPTPSSGDMWKLSMFVVREVSGVKFNNLSKPTLCLLSAKKFYKASWVCPMLPFKVSKSNMSLHNMAVHEIKSQTHPCSGPLPLWRL